MNGRAEKRSAFRRRHGGLRCAYLPYIEAASLSRTSTSRRLALHNEYSVGADIRNLRTIEEDYRDPEKLLAELDAAEDETVRPRDQVKAILTAALVWKTRMHPDLVEKRDSVIALCRRLGVARLDVFGSAARGGDFDPQRSDADFLVTFGPAARNDLAAFADFKAALESLLGRPIDLVERPAIEASRNYIRRRRILAEAETVYGG